MNTGFKIHPHGGGKITWSSEVEKTVYLAPEVVVINSTIRGTSRIEGQYLIEGSYARDLVISQQKDRKTDTGYIKNTHLMECTIKGAAVIDSCFSIASDFHGGTSSLQITYFAVFHSFLKGCMTLLGTPTKPFSYPDSQCPRIVRSRLEGDFSLEMFHDEEIYCVIVEQNNFSEITQANRALLVNSIYTNSDRN